MKRAITLLLMVFVFAGGILAEEQPILRSKSGIPILPEAGDFAIGVNGGVMLDFVGNMFNNTVNNTSRFDFLDPDTRFIFGKYFLEDLKAVRVGVRLGQQRLVNAIYLLEDQPGGAGSKGDDPEYVLDRHITSQTNIMLGLGMEWRKGVHRIQGFYGVDLGLAVMRDHEAFKYGNEISSDNTNPSTTNFGNNIWAGSRATKLHQGFGFMVGVRGFVGFEYFILPKLSVGGEFGWGPAVGFLGKSYAELESWDAVKEEVVIEERPVGRGNVINIDTDNANGVIKLLFHF